MWQLRGFNHTVGPLIYDDLYNAMANSSWSWIYFSCGLPNFTNSLFTITDLSSPNKFDSLSSLSESRNVAAITLMLNKNAILTSTGHSPSKKTKINGIILNCNGFKGAADPDNTIPSSLGFAKTRLRPGNWIRAVPRHHVYSVFPPDYTLITNYFLSTLMFLFLLTLRKNRNRFGVVSFKL